MNNQYKKGVVELCILSLLSRGDSYGYDVSDILTRHMDLSEGAVYPILRKLKDDGLVSTYLSEASGGPPRKYYTLTKTGRQVYEIEKKDWLEFARTIEKILEGDEYGPNHISQ
ncbi:MAG TPA: PadR family transcriptional regulator [Clostridiales bacterium]|nr:PadR family transcriptional regulator [Clostridiales bacterium]